MQFFFCSAFLLYFCEIHRVDRGEGHVGHALIVRVGSVHALYFEMMLSSSKYFSFIRLRANAPPTADKNPIEIASRKNNLIIFFFMVAFLVEHTREPGNIPHERDAKRYRLLPVLQRSSFFIKNQKTRWFFGGCLTDKGAIVLLVSNNFS